MTHTSETKPPGPPPGPPPPPGSGPPPSGDAGPVDPTSPKGRYAAWLVAHGKKADPIVEGRVPGGTWSLFFVGGAPGAKSDPAAIGPDAIVAPRVPEGWAAFLASSPPESLHEQVAWLHGMWGALVPDSPSATSVVAKFPAVEPHLAPPLREEIDGGLRFTAWYFEPPAMTPFRFTITATASGTEFQRTKLSDLATP